MLILKDKLWDSSFFGRKIGMISLKEKILFEDFTSFLKKSYSNGYKLIYCLSDFILDFPSSTSIIYNLVDKKVIYQGNISKIYIKTLPNHIIEFKGQPSDLYELSYEAGKYSRFKKDPLFSEEEFKRLYRSWIDNSLNHTFAKKVLVSQIDDFITGFISIQRINQKINCSLIAVHPSFRKQGIGTSLFNAFMEYGVSSGCNKMEVTTQEYNKQACSFYESFGMNKISSTYVYHIWLKQ